ncbi:MAG: iron-containing alcohol dehydrogenase [Bacteroidetes bacterium]|nr:iron-containing alcohol dehydrogenase [Bacteroidota bacterium]
MLLPQDWTFPVPIAYGPGRLSEIGTRCAQMGITNPLIVTDRGSRDLPFIAALQTHLGAAGLTCAVFSEISPNPRDDEVAIGKSTFNQGGYDCVIAIGGGSAMDGGKSICLTARNDLDLWAFEWEEPPAELGPDQAFPKLITIPTTAGTGAETESTAMVTHSEKGMKYCICHPDLKPSLALLDPELTVGLPRNLTAWTGADAMTHAIEAYLVPGFHPLCDGMALEGLSLVSRWLPVVMREPDNLAARGGMLVGSCLAGIAFAKGLGLTHAISHMVGAEFDTQHGLTNAIVLPVVLRFNLPGLEHKVRRMAEIMQIEDHSEAAFIARIEGILDALDIPKSLSKIGVPLECAEEISHKALLDSAAGTNPRPADAGQVQRLIETAIIAAR